VWNRDSATVTCSYDLEVFNKFNYHSNPVYNHSYAWQYLFGQSLVDHR
jgi:hypothetical protein